jgi:DNA-binding response OmpR family regulator
MKAGAADYVTKPFDVERVIAKLRVLAGVGEGEPVVVSANFLIDAESNLKAALKGFSDPEAKP